LNVGKEKGMKVKRKHSKSIFLAWFFGILSLILAVVLTFAGLVIVKLHRSNLFSRSILTGNNYFMDQLMYDLSNDVPEQDREESSLNNIYIDPLADEYIREYLVYDENGNLSIVAEPVDADIAAKVKLIVDAVKLEAPVYLDSITLSNMIINKLYAIYESGGINSDSDREAEEYLTQFGIVIELDSIGNGSEYLIEVPYLSQEGILPNGCEAVSAVMLLQYLGFNISPEEFVDEYLVCGETSIRFGCRVGPNPKEMYAGDPRSENGGFGCFAPVIVRALNSYLPSGYYAKNTTGLSLETLKRRYVDNGIPVAVWVTVGMEEVDRILQWQSEDGKETYLYPANEHCMVFVGYDEDSYIFADPYDSNGVVKYPVDDCVLAFNMLGSQSVVILSAPMDAKMK